MTEQRTAQRQRTLKGGLIAFNGGRSTMSCTIRNLSAGGAQLKVPSTIGIPDAFELRLIDKSTIHCDVVWRRASELGVKFPEQ